MTQTNQQSYDNWIGQEAYDASGEKIGKIKDIYYDDVSGRPEWVAISAGLFKGNRLVPIAGATQMADGEGLRLNFDQDRMSTAPDISDEGHLNPDEEKRLYSHYGFNWDTREKDFGYGEHFDQPRVDKDYDRSKFGAIGQVGTEDRGTVAAEATVRNQEAQVVENTEQVRLRKYQHTEMVPVTKEEVRVERVQDNDRPGIRQAEGAPQVIRKVVVAGAAACMFSVAPAAFAAAQTVPPADDDVEIATVDDDDDESDKTGLWGLLGLLGLAGLAGLKRRNEPVHRTGGSVSADTTPRGSTTH